MIPRNKRKKGQAVVEIALFGTLILMILGVLISQLQNANERQYAQMESFRRTLEKACNYLPEKGAGASVSTTLMQDRHLVTAGGNYKKGADQRFSANSNIYWAIPYVEKDSESTRLTYIRVNEDEQTWNYRDFIPKEHDATDEDGEERQRYWSFGVEDISTDSALNFTEQVVKEESPEAIINTNTSGLQDTINTTITYAIKEKDKDDEDYESVIEEGTLWDPVQGEYRDQDGQYKFDDAQVGTEIQRGQTLRTEF